MITHLAPLTAMMTIARFTFREALRDRLLFITLGMIGAGWGGVLFLNALLLDDSTNHLAGVLGFFLRLGSVFQIFLLVTFAVSREMYNQGLEMLLALPFPRAVIVLGKLCGFALVAVVLAAACGLAVLPLMPSGQVVLWSLVLGCELLLMATVALFLSLAMRQPSLVMTLCVGFYLLARSMSALQLMALQIKELVSYRIGAMLQVILTVIAGVVPDLDHFTVTEWLVYQTGSPSMLWPVLGETLIYLCLLSALGLVDFYRKDF